MEQQMMKALGFRRYGPAEVLEPMEVANPTLAPDGVLIRVAAAGVNPADTYLRSGQLRFFARLPFPIVPGSDVAGIVEAVGPEVTRFQPGDAVYTMLPTAVGGGYAEYATAKESNVAHAPSTRTLAEAASVPLTALTALQALRDQARLQSGQHILIYGASGGVGTSAVQIAKAMGARVTGVSSGRNIHLVRSLGADKVLDYTRDDLKAGEGRYDVIFGAVNILPFWRWRRALRPGGTIVTVNPLFDNGAIQWLTYTVTRTHLKALIVQPSGADLQGITSWVDCEKVRPVIDQFYPLADAIRAHEYSETQRARGKLVLVVDEALAGAKAGSSVSFPIAVVA